MQMLVCLILSHNSLKLTSLFFTHFSFSFHSFFLLWLNEFHFPFLGFTDTFFIWCSMLLNPSIEFYNKIIVFFSSMISVYYFLIFSVSLFRFSLYSCIVLQTSVSIFMTIISNSLSGKLLVFISLRSFSAVYLVLLFGTYFPLFLHLPWLSVLISVH